MKRPHSFRGSIDRVYRITCGECVTTSHFGGERLIDLDEAASKERAVLVAHAAGWRYDHKRRGRGWLCPACLEREVEAREAAAEATEES